MVRRKRDSKPNPDAGTDDVTGADARVGAGADAPAEADADLPAKAGADAPAGTKAAASKPSRTTARGDAGAAASKPPRAAASRPSRSGAPKASAAGARPVAAKAGGNAESAADEEPDAEDAAGNRIAWVEEGEGGDGYLAGQLLIATPSMRDPRFARSVICICAHSADGAMGIVLNKPIDNLTFDDLLKQLDVAPVPPARRIALHTGGPVESGRGFVLHTSDWSSEGSLKVHGDLALTASVDILKAIAGGGGPRRGLLALGYAGWGPGQLESEIEGSAWLSVDPDEALLFEEEANDEAKWRRALDKLRVDPLLLVAAVGRA